MANDLSEAVKVGLINDMAGDASLTAIVPATSIFPMHPNWLPDLPFIRLNPMTVSPWEATCGKGVEVNVTVHALLRSEPEAQDVAGLIASAIDEDPAFFSCDWQRTQFMPDPSGTDIWTAAVDFRVVHIA